MIIDQPAITVVSKGWGFEKVIANDGKYCGKMLYIIKNKKSSLYYHKMKYKTFYVQSGKIAIYYSDDLNKIQQTIKQISSDMLASVLYNNNDKFIAEEHKALARLDRIILKKGDNFYIPVGRVHQILAFEDSEVFEFSTQHFDSDIYRLIKGD
jgi:uncharacterized RmlC-like cupin family protein